MNKAWLLLLLLLPLLFLSACAEKDEGHPGFLDPMIRPEGDFYLLIENNSSDEHDSHDLYLRVIGKDLCDTLKLNGHIYPRTHYSINVDYKYYHVDFEPQPSDWLILDENERNLSYEIIFKNRSVSGTIKVPPQINVDFPDYDRLQDYSVSWTIPETPDFFSYSLWMHDDDNAIKALSNLDNNVRSHTLNKEIWKGMWLTSFSFELTANNYKREHKGMIWVMRTKEKYKSWGHYSHPRTPFAPFEQLMRGETSIPGKK